MIYNNSITASYKHHSLLTFDTKSTNNLCQSIHALISFVGLSLNKVHLTHFLLFSTGVKFGLAHVFGPKRQVTGQ